MKHIAVLKGGWSAEREVSLVSGAACAKALRELGHKVTEIDVQPDIADVLAKLKPDVAFNALHGRFGEDGCLQGVLEILKIPYTHSGVLASSVAMDKPLAKVVFAAAGLRVPVGKVVARGALNGDPMQRPYVAKPSNEGSSVGVHLVMESENRTLQQMIAGEDEPYYLIEEYIPGRELTVAVLDGKALAVTELRPKSGFYDYENKYTDGKTEHLIPAPLAQPLYDEVMRQAVAAHVALSCRGLSRSDFRLDERKPGVDGLYILELNTQPGMTPLSLSPEQAAYAGISFNSLVQKLVDGAKLGA